MAEVSDKYDLNARELLEEADLEEALVRTLKYANWKSRCCSWLGHAVSADCLVNEAIARAYGVGTSNSDTHTFRNWDKTRYPDLADFLISTINSMVNHIVEHHENFQGASFDEEGGQDDPHKASKLNQAAQGTEYLVRSRNPEEMAVISEERNKIRKCLDEIAEKDDEAGLVIMALEDGFEKPAEIAEVLQLDIDTVYNIIKRLRRKLREGMGCDNVNRKDMVAR